VELSVFHQINFEGCDHEAPLPAIQRGEENSNFPKYVQLGIFFSNSISGDRGKSVGPIKV
jgi:hypothetical protein